MPRRGESPCIWAGPHGEGEILSWDVHPHRVRLIDKNCERLGWDFVRTQVQDATQDRKPLWGGFDLVHVGRPMLRIGRGWAASRM